MCQLNTCLLIYFYFLSLFSNKSSGVIWYLLFSACTSSTTYHCFSAIPDCSFNVAFTLLHPHYSVKLQSCWNAVLRIFLVGLCLSVTFHVFLWMLMSSKNVLPAISCVVPPAPWGPILLFEPCWFSSTCALKSTVITFTSWVGFPFNITYSWSRIYLSPLSRLPQLMRKLELHLLWQVITRILQLRSDCWLISSPSALV